MKKMDIEKRTNSHQKLLKWSPKHSKSSPKPFKIEGRHATFFARGGSGRPKTRIRTSTQAKRGEDTTAYIHFDRKRRQHGAKWASKIEPKSKKYRCKNRLKNWCLSRSISKSMLMDFWTESGSMLHQNRIKNLRSQKMWKTHLELAR